MDAPPGRASKAIKYAVLGAAPTVFIINCKNYAEVMAPRDMRTLIEQARRSSARHGIPIAVAPPATMLAMAAEAAGATPSAEVPSWALGGGAALDTGAALETAMQGRRRSRAPNRPLILAQHTDAADLGSTTGQTTAEAVRATGADGSIVNHSEFRILPRHRRRAVERLRGQGLLSVMCAATGAEVGTVSTFAPDYVALEPPALIGTGRAVSKERPGLIMRAAKVVDRAVLPPKARGKPASPRPRLLCGAGIVTAEDVRQAVLLGSTGILVASGIVKAKNRAAAIDSFARALASAARERDEAAREEDAGGGRQ